MSKYKAGDKFIIEIEQAFKPTNPFDNELYRIKGFRSLVFDKNGLDRLERLEEREKKNLALEPGCVVEYRDDDNIFATRIGVVTRRNDDEGLEYTVWCSEGRERRFPRYRLSYTGKIATGLACTVLNAKQGIEPKSEKEGFSF